MQRKSALLVSQKIIQYACQSILGIDTVWLGEWGMLSALSGQVE